MARVVVTEGIDEQHLRPLAGHDLVVPPLGDRFDAARLRQVLPGADGLVCFLTDRVDEALLSAAPELRVIGNVATGVNNIDLAAAVERGIAVCNTPEGPVESTAELTMLLMLAASRRMGEAEHELRSGVWQGWSFTGLWGFDLAGGTLGLIGYGRIARAVRRRAEAFGMTVLHYARRPTGESGQVDRLDELLRRADVVSVHVPLTEQTRDLIGEPQLRLMKPTATLINTARGGVVNEAALLAALRRGDLFAAALDVFDNEPEVWSPLLAERRLVVTPHIGSATRQARLAMLHDVVSDVAAVLRGAEPDRPVSMS